MAFGTGTINSIGSAVNDLFASRGHELKAEGLRLEANSYDEASALSLQNAAFTETSTAIKQSQLDREIYKTIGGITADTASSGFETSGSSLDILRDSASQGALTKAVAGQQGLITEAGYKEQAQSYTNLAGAARLSADAEDNAAKGSTFASIIHGASAIASLFV